MLSEGHTLYFGAPSHAVDWFSGNLGYSYQPQKDGAVSDWLMDAVSVGFTKPSDFAARLAAITSPCPAHDLTLTIFFQEICKSLKMLDFKLKTWIMAHLGADFTDLEELGETVKCCSEMQVVEVQGGSATSTGR